MNKKYELLQNDKIEYNEKILYRIKALKSFYDVEKGDLGGYIESERNLSHEGLCWVYDSAKVYDYAEVFENAIVSNNAEIYGNAKVSKNSSVSENAKIYGNARLYGNAEVYENAHVYGNAKVYENANLYGYARIYDSAEICGSAEVYESAEVCGNAKVYENAKVFGIAVVNKNFIIGQVSMAFKDIFQYKCKNRIFTAILTENKEILYTINCQINITKEELIKEIKNKNGGLEKNPYRIEYLKLISAVEAYFKS